MTQKEEQLLFKDLCARLPYGVIYHRNDGANIELREVDIKNGTLNYTDNIVMRDCKPYLRPMSSMTKEERKVYMEIGSHLCGEIVAKTMIDWLNAHYFDYHSLIPMGLALEAPDGMYK